MKVVSETTRLILDVGSELESTHNPKVPRIEGLFRGEAGYDAVLISHHFLDHSGLIPYISPEIPVYMSKRTYAFYRFTSQYQRMNVLREPVLFDEDAAVNGSTSFTIGDIKVTPYWCGGSAYDAYMFLLENAGEKILYTGGFRYDGRPEPAGMIDVLPQVDTLLVEGTMISRPFAAMDPEPEWAAKLRDCGAWSADGAAEALVQRRLEELMVPLPPVFLLASSTNIPRFRSIAEAVSRTSRTLLIDPYQAGILEGEDPSLMDARIHPEIRVFLVGGRGQEQTDALKYESQLIGNDVIPFKHIAMCVRPSRTMEQYLTGLDAAHSLQGASLIVSTWKGIGQQADTRRFLDHCKTLGMNISYVHTSGIDDLQALRALAAKTRPRQIVPVHSYEPEKLAALLMP